jgi:hypothetical protein
VARACAAPGLVLALCVALPATAAPANPRLPVIESLAACRAIVDAGQRLACYDRAAAGLDEAERKGEVVVIDRARAEAAHREAFGLPVPSLDFIAKTLSPGNADRISGVVRSARADANGYWTVALEDGAVWRMIDGMLSRPPRAGSKVSIARASLGSFKMNVDGQPAVRVHRDQ